ncbi:MAG: PilZ domain-containing protein [Terracidiphilus sp.]|jgi:hypothetical protein
MSTTLAISGQGEDRGRAARYRDRRDYERYEVNTPGGCLNYKGVRFPCLIVDVSLSGCCVRSEIPFLPGALANVEVVLPIHGMLLRMVGTTQWVTRENLIGIRFLHGSSRAKNQLAGLLTCLVDKSAADAVRAALVHDAAAKTSGPALALEIPEDLLLSLNQPEPPPQQVVEAEDPEPEPPTGEPNSDSSDNSMGLGETEDWPAALQLLKDGSHVSGSIVGLSQEGCKMRTALPFMSGIHVRVEVEFQMCGLHFRLMGVVENLRGKNTLEIRFLEMSRRKRDEIEELMTELKETAKKRP